MHQLLLFDPMELFDPAEVAQLKERLDARPAEFDRFFRRYAPGLVGFLVVQGASIADANEIAQESMIEAYRDWTAIAYPASWIRVVASRKLRHRLKLAARESSLDLLLAGNEDQRLLSSGDEFTAEESLEAMLTNLDLHRFLQRLPQRQRQILAWTMQGYTPKEIADILHLSPEGVRSSLHKARDTLRPLVAAEGVYRRPTPAPRKTVSRRRRGR
ncbi:sigma-70 family RNA polymerase sigma factor [Nocardia tengchongensis]|uniref:Sigma-70 family RNA polymerase sigma factor n=1 Tax=Nocardia tengchongensis TaxID=2055889 RepID=A0ABX8CLA3_9NOCA|nr:sigma-70 family RNA polymerase sigma factor [Nocardia tengchongensis]QVI19689.1 sigma-70 family RNA polymerase sigma factor [Nocardia tengchongensis]